MFYDMYQYRNRFVITDTVMCMIVVTNYVANKTAAVSFLSQHNSARLHHARQCYMTSPVQCNCKVMPRTYLQTLSSSGSCGRGYITLDKHKNNHFMRAFYYLFNTFLITCFQYTSTNVGKNLGGLAPQTPDERRLWE